MLQDRSARVLETKFRLISEPGVVLVPFTPTDRPAGRLDLIASLPLLLPSITPPALALEHCIYWDSYLIQLVHPVLHEVGEVLVEAAASAGLAEHCGLYVLLELQPRLRHAVLVRRAQLLLRRHPRPAHPRVRGGARQGGVGGGRQRLAAPQSSSIGFWNLESFGRGTKSITSSSSLRGLPG